jgi:hypothetical protein
MSHTMPQKATFEAVIRIVPFAELFMIFTLSALSLIDSDSVQTNKKPAEGFAPAAGFDLISVF